MDLPARTWWRMVFPSFDEMVKTPAMTNLLLSAQADEQVSREQFEAIEPELIVDVADAMARVCRKLARLLRHEAIKGAASSSAATKNAPEGIHKDFDKGKARADSLDQQPAIVENGDIEEDAEADKALLEQLSSLFVCEHPLCKFSQAAGRPVLMSFFGVLEHQSLHNLTHGTWDDIAVAPADQTWHTRAPDLLDAIGLPQDSKLSAVRERILSGTARCTASACANADVVPGLGMGVGVSEDALLCNMLTHVSRPTGVDATTMQPVYGRHDITFDPPPENSLYGNTLLNAGFASDGGLPLVRAPGYLASHGQLPWQDFGIASVEIPPIIQPFVYGGGVPPRPGPSRLS